MNFNSILDTGISDYNLGNQIIMDSVYKEIYHILDKDFFFKLQFSEKFDKRSINTIVKSKYCFFGGTNSLTGDIMKNKQFGFSFLDSLRINNLILMGVGWHSYEGDSSFLSKIFWNKILDKNVCHSVRDSYTENKFKNDFKLNNVVNTSCPTVWGLTKEHCNLIPEKKSNNVVFTLTDYSRDYINDKIIVNLLLKMYENLFFWPQGVGDIDYIKDLLGDLFHVIKIIPPNVVAYDNFLKNNDVDYVGTRLHGGIRALQYKKRTLIVAIDNRAIEMGKDINLPYINRDKVVFLKDRVNSIFETRINIPLDKINMWRAQFYD